MKLLLDENLSPRVAQWLREKGLDAAHVRDRGMLSATDPQVFQRAFDEDRIVVTANIKDFEKLAKRAGLHGGVICIEDAAVSRADQLALIEAALAALAGADPVNTFVYVRASGAIELVALPDA